MLDLYIISIERTIWIHPGYVRSKNDGQEHYISAQRLANLYKVDLNAPNVRVYDPDKPETTLGVRFSPQDIHLEPLYNGEYNPPK
ncbi:MAG: hypothetical protein R3250_00145 [Melioribacteraceae bacterium]|nr:hypothetical protein [Melioribacteraceae bacterium]